MQDGQGRWWGGGAGDKIEKKKKTVQIILK